MALGQIDSNPNASKKDRPFYLAGPFFNDEQRMTLATIETHCKDLKMPVFSPRLECLCPPDASIEQRESTFYANITHVRLSRFVLARIDDFDPGTMWELGYAYASGARMIAFTTVPGRGLNLMIAQSGATFLQGMDKVLEFLTAVQTRGDFSLAIPWRKEIV